MVISPPGSGTLRKMAESTGEWARMFLIHSGIFAKTARARDRTANETNASFVPRLRRLVLHFSHSSRPLRAGLTSCAPDGAKCLGKHFNLHLLAANVVGDVFGGYDQSVVTGREVCR